MELALMVPAARDLPSSVLLGTVHRLPKRSTCFAVIISFSVAVLQ